MEGEPHYQRLVLSAGPTRASARGEFKDKIAKFLQPLPPGKGHQTGKYDDMVQVFMLVTRFVQLIQQDFSQGWQGTPQEPLGGTFYWCCPTGCIGGPT
jgi:hypothetical protein